MELKHAILGLLSIRSMSGYDLGRAFAGSVAHFWHADQSQIYRTIDRLASGALIETEVIPQIGRPDRKVHTLTPAGYAELERWLESPLEEDRPKIPLLARMFFVASLGGDAVERLLDEATARATGELERLRAIDTGETDDVAGVLRAATLDYGIAAGETELEWLRATRRRLDTVKAEEAHDDGRE